VDTSSPGVDFAMHTVAAVVNQGCLTFDLAVPCEVFGWDALRTVAHHQQLHGQAIRSQASQHMHDLGYTFYAPEIRDVDENLLAVRTDRLPEIASVLTAEAIDIHKVRDDLDFLPDSKMLVGFLAKVIRNRRHPIGLIDGISHHRGIGGVLADNRDIRSVKGRHDRYVPALLEENLPREHGAGSMRNRVVHMEQVQFFMRDDIDHLACQRKRVGGIFE
jgi:hypothetical protein